MDDTPASPDVDPTAPPAGEASAPAAAPAAPAAPWEGPSPDVVAWLLVNWHNRHPLARRLGIADVHTVGAVALPFMAQALPREPSLEAGAAIDATATPAPAKRRLPWQRKVARPGPRPAWIDEFIPGLKTAAVAAMALDNGFTTAPDELPLRRVDIDERALAAEANQAGAWPMELVLLSAAFDAGPARRRVLVGRRDQVLGQRALDPARLGVAGCIAVLVLIAAIWALWPSSKPSEQALAAQAAAEAASAASAAAAARAASEAALQALATSAAAEAASAASATAAATEAASGASAAASAPAEQAPTASAPASSAIPSIRPSLHSGVGRAQRDTEQAAAATADAVKAGSGRADDGKAVDGKADGRAEAAMPGSSAADGSRVAVDETGLSSLMKRDPATPGAKVVALVGAPYKSKADAEAALARMREMVGQTTGGASLSGGVFQTKEGWRAAVWPFGSREEAQLINATLLARGIRGTRAVDF
ncbi:MAG: hypothetical protein EOP37_14780 [Rubrivivax sp.]|nr:MAG: hypothetical protein EOP37_14780 [Rubrivivax sp.]